MHKLPKLCTTLLALLLLSHYSFATVRYARPTSQGDGSGTSWATASSDIQALINASSAGDEIWVAAGTYKPTHLSDNPTNISVNSRADSYVLKSGVKIYGGFSGSETSLTERNWGTNVTILSGDLNSVGTNNDNANNVVVSVNCDSNTELNGFTITGGYIDNNWEQRTINGTTVSVYNGAGILSQSSDTRFKNLIITNCRANRGAGIYIQSGTPYIENITISSNTSSDRGGGIYISSSSAILSNITLSNNTSWSNGGGMVLENSNCSITNSSINQNTSNDNGGGMYLNSSSPTITNSSIISNTNNNAWGNGGGVFNYNSNPVITNALICKNSTGGSGGGVASENNCSPTLINATIANNTARQQSGNGGAVFGNATLKNCIIWDNLVGSSTANLSGTMQLSNCLSQSGTVDGNSVVSNSDPRFNNTATNDYSLKGYSPAVNRGNNNYNSSSTDLAGNTRIFNSGIIDLGPYEYQSTDTSFPPRTRIVYVKSGASGNGTSWSNAYGQLSDAITECNNTFDIAEIWVAAGTYTPQNYAGNGTSNQNKSFILPANIKIYGGFVGTETLLSQRNATAHETILSGNSTSYHVIISSGNVGTATLDGFTITGGASGYGGSITVNSNSINSTYGAGIYCANSSPVLSNLTIRNNISISGGGGIYCNASSPIMSNCKIYSNTTNNGPGGGIACYISSVPTITNCNFYSNTAVKGGGGIYCNASSPTISNCQIYSCSSTNGGGGGIGIVASSSPTITNSKIYSNNATSIGGGISIDTSTPNLTNLLIYKNTATQHGGAIYVSSGSATITNATIAYNSVPVDYGKGGLEGTILLQNSILWGNTANGISANTSSSTTFSYCLVESGTLSGTSIISNTNPRFTAPATDDYSLNGYSPGVNAGNNAYNTTTTDLAGNPRIYDNATIDLGAYEYQRYNTSTPETIQILYVKKGTTGGDGTSWAKAYGELSDALLKCESQGGISQIWVAAGTYLPQTLTGNGTQTKDKSFIIPKDIKIYGGFGGNETSLNQRKWTTNPTILSGNNTYNHVVLFINNAGTASLDGFEITGGAATTNSGQTVTAMGYTIDEHSGGGIYCVNSSPTLNNLKIHNNAGINTGAIYCTDSSNPTISNSLIYSNSSSQLYATIRANNSSPVIINTTISNNSGPNWGVETISGNIIFKNSIIWGNYKTTIGGSPTFSYCLVQGQPVSGTSVISNSDPKLDANYRLTTGSPAIDTGNNSYVSSFSYDLDRHSRIANNTVDLGAYEFNSIINQWVGTTSGDPEVASNWAGNSVPANDEYFEFSASATRNMSLSKDRSIRNVDNSTVYSIDLNGHKLTLKGDLSFTGTGRIIASNANSTIELAGTAAQTIEDGIFNGNTIGKLTINNTAGVTLKSDQVNCGTLTINAGTSLTVPAAKWMNVTGTVTNNAGVSGLILKASETLPAATFTFGNTSANPVSATVEMYSKAYKDANGPTGYKYKWQFFGIPVKSITANKFMGSSYIKEYDETSATSQGIWKTISGSSTMTSLKGYEITQQAEKTLTFTGVLENANINKNLSYTSGNTYAGQHIISNPYTSAININQLTFTNAEATVYLYNTGSFSDWNSNQSSTTVSNNPGQYVGAPKITAGSGGIPSSIPAMQGFLVKATGSGANISYSYASNQKNSTLQRVKSNSKSDSQEHTYIVINVNGQRYSDKLWLFNSPDCSTSFDNGWDAFKLSAGTASSAPMIYSQRGDSLYQIDCVNNIDGTPVSFVSGEDDTYTLSFEQQNLSTYFNSVQLIDLFTGISTDITDASAGYTFTSTTDDSNRFRIQATKDIPTNDDKAASQQFKTYFTNGKLFITNNEANGGELRIYNAAGKLCKCILYTPYEIKNMDINLQNGIYILKSTTTNYQYKFAVIR